MVTKEYLLSVAASKALAKTEWCEEDNACLGYIDGYKQGDIDRHKIDVEKAKTSFCISCNNAFCPKECSKLQRFINRLNE